ncbi:NADH-quinone oxidoreductase subunit L [Puniceicoccales bacterium CK1056]|uniref:NADH-quinone oxidoreductase subunit L n=1 Tax=Oceanipulchritudo coccoides TaxID=2706888 RepID=A0A6B2M125_9BACT|nr:NADH-quinone oxidoreductase subunit L [Oceanipulchritudo coccoides]NDV62423.1 NADH-quinone oxidoreductase subunit L [Oceanipulchritudo coccoides]
MDLGTVLSGILLAPLIAAGLIWMFARQRAGLAMALSLAAAATILGLSAWLFFGLWNGEAYEAQVEWLTLGNFTLSVGFLLNDLSALMLFVVSFVGFWIHLFSVGYMTDDGARGRFFGGLSIFMFSMLGIVLANNLFMMFIFWELVGFSSYMLIGHYLKTQEASDASKKAFIVNRVGDFGFLIGIILTFWTFGTVSLSELAVQTSLQPELVTTLGALLLFCGVLGKSAQMPLHVWLPDAMAGPTPISALIHAATMVAAGVYFLGRTVTLFTPEALTTVAWVGVVTAVCAAIWAFGQRDIKKILAYSTLSQLGYMVAGFGLGTLYGLHHGDSATALYYGIGASMFHLTTHAFFKALLFLGSGSVIHACHHEQDIFKMGGLYKKMPLTTLTFGAGVIAIAGIPFIASAFFSKDAILYVAKSTSQPAFIILTGTALLTALYMGRLFVIAFLGKPNSESAEHAHESSWTMVLPLVVLAVFSIGGGYLVMYPEALQVLIGTWVPHPHGADHTLMIIISTVASFGGLILARIIYGAGSTTDTLEAKIPPVYALAKSRFYFDEMYNGYVRLIQDRVANIIGFFDTLFISGMLVRGSAGLAGLLGIAARRMHTGSVATYVWWFFAGLVLFGAYAGGFLDRIFQ